MEINKEQTNVKAERSFDDVRTNLNECSELRIITLDPMSKDRFNPMENLYPTE